MHISQHRHDPKDMRRATPTESREVEARLSEEKIIRDGLGFVLVPKCFILTDLTERY